MEVMSNTTVVTLEPKPSGKNDKIWVEVGTPKGYELDKENSTFDHIVFKKKDTLPKTWYEFQKDKATTAWALSTQWEKTEYASAAGALSKLIWLRDCYNDGWMPDYDNHGECKYCIYYSDNEIHVDNFNYMHFPLAFKTKELRDEFLKNFKDLIKQAKPLL